MHACIQEFSKLGRHFSKQSGYASIKDPLIVKALQGAQDTWKGRALLASVRPTTAYRGTLLGWYLRVGQ